MDITNLDTDSREIRPGGLFVCVPGFHVDGHDYARQAIRNGAVAIVAERESLGLPGNVTHITVPDTRRILPILANAFLEIPRGD